QARGRMSARELAAEFEVSVRTIHRDVDQLSAAGIPVYADRGRSGGFALLDGYRTKLTGLTPAEAEALFLTGLPGPAAQLGLAAPLSGARLKLKAALPANLHQNAERIASRFHLDPVGWFRGADPLPALQTVAQATWSGRYLNLRYRNSGQTYGRKLGPLGIVLKGGVWYLVAQSGNSVRTYRVEQILDAQVSDEAFARPASFDLASHWEKSSRAYEAGLYRTQAEVRLSARGMARLSVLGSHVANAARQTAGAPDREGWRRCTVPLESGEHGIRELLRLGDEIEVIGPPELRREYASLVAAMARRYGASRATAKN
ncbi:MAG TPA: WYL domain-containing protein, partial [Rhizomicrobium sp.]|nr:WYL domain-containing protein [Rhizomicrobium sp.]